MLNRRCAVSKVLDEYGKEDQLSRTAASLEAIGLETLCFGQGCPHLTTMSGKSAAWRHGQKPQPPQEDWRLSETGRHFTCPGWYKGKEVVELAWFEPQTGSWGLRDWCNWKVAAPERFWNFIWDGDLGSYWIGTGDPVGVEIEGGVL
jgi:hypothetical protein